MAKQYYGCIRLTKHNPGWSDPINDIHLLRTHRTFKCVLEDYDLRPIMKGIKEGLIEFTRADIEGTADSDDGARLPMYCGHCICQAHLIKEGVLADYQADVDYQSDLEWQPPQPAERPAPTPSVQVTIPAQIEAGAEEVFQVKLDQLKPKKEMVDTGEVDENGEPIMEEQEVHQTVTVNVSATGGTVEPTTLTFSSDPESADYYMNAKEVKFTAPDESANVSIEFSGDGVKPFSKNVKVQGDEPIPEEPDQPAKNPVIKINGSSDVIEIQRGETSFEGVITVEYGDCSAADLPLIEIEFVMTSAGGAKDGATFNGADRVTFDGIGMPSDWRECVAATLSVSMPCTGTPQHRITQEFQVKVPQMGVFFGGITGANFAIQNQAGKTLGDSLIAHGMREYKNYEKEAVEGPAGHRIMVALPKGCGANFISYDAGGTDVTIGQLTQASLSNPKETEVYGVPYEVWYGNPKGGAVKMLYTITI